MPNNEKENSLKDVLLAEYQQLMESQRDNTRIAYGWINSIILVLSSGLIFYGFSSDKLASFIPAMVLGIALCLIWAGLTEVFARYSRQRFSRLEEISNELGIPKIPFSPSKWWLPITQARTYVWLFVFVYIVAWIIRYILVFL